MKLQNVEIKQAYPHGFGRGAKPGFACIVSLQYGELSYEKFDVTLSSEATREILALAAAKAMEQSAIDLNAINVDGVAGEPEVAEEVPPPRILEDKAPAPEAEVL